MNNTTEVKRNKILAAALQAYTKYGINKTTTRQIAEIADIGKSTIYEYFKSKQELLNESFIFLMHQLDQGKKSIHTIAEEDPMTALKMYLDNTIHIALNEPGTLLLISQYTLEIMLNSDKYEEAKSEYQRKLSPLYESLMNELSFIIDRGIKQGSFKPVINIDVENIVYILGALVREIQAQAFIKDREELNKACMNIKETIGKLLSISEFY
ncbi:MAG: TetR/AcrR family transcriptional regulator [Bacillota bacterium]|nr:TetR/AcrR family transcriptional regulator [Bacillota bacterium]